jgi:hypothetical protein
MSTSNLLMGGDRSYNDGFNQSQKQFMGHNKNNFSGGVGGLTRKGYNKSYKDLRVGNFGTNRIHKSPSNAKMMSHSNMMDHPSNFNQKDLLQRQKSPMTSSKSNQVTNRN